MWVPWQAVGWSRPIPLPHTDHLRRARTGSVRMLGFSTLLIVSLVRVAPAVPLFPPEHDRRAPDFTILRSELGHVHRTLRGDWELPSTTLFVFSPEWLDALTDMVSQASKAGPVFILVVPE